jgi:hypothetical protein
MNTPRFRYSKCEPIPGDTGERFDCPENGYYNMTSAEMARADAEEVARGMEAPAGGETEGLDPKGDSPVGTTRPETELGIDQ